MTEVKNGSAGRAETACMAAKPVDVEALLEHLPMFHQLRADQRHDLALATRRIVASKGDTLFNRGDAPLGMYVVVYGQVKLAFVGTNGVEKVIDVRAAGQSFGEAVLFLEKPHVV